MCGLRLRLGVSVGVGGDRRSKSSRFTKLEIVMRIGEMAVSLVKRVCCISGENCHFGAVIWRPVYMAGGRDISADVEADKICLNSTINILIGKIKMSILADSRYSVFSLHD